jgi:hypothetical protein
MLLWLAEFLARFESGFQVFQYLTFRGILGVLTSLAITLCVGPKMIARLNHYQIGQAVRADGPESHLSKSGTPTMGGALILVGIILSTLLWADLTNRYIWVVLGVTIIFGAGVAGTVEILLAVSWWFGRCCFPLLQRHGACGNGIDRTLFQECVCCAWPRVYPANLFRHRR